MPMHTGELAVHGHLEQREEKVLLVVHERLSGLDTFLSATLRLDRPIMLPQLPVRILTFDDVTVLSPLGPAMPQAQASEEWSGTLLLPHGARPPTIPDDLAQAAAAAGVDTSGWSPAEARQLLTFLGEAGPGPVRTERIGMIIATLAGRS
ncbi:hypothetical protein [Streptomyces olivochromogenes]|uniref:Uncharacterized protein n=1 Tax=Streptomyces olivochromogenes TaxID=1963 RepID=A0A250VRI4_STROL|nr:hypothetical protein [Streptomyces olivochromogenes]KUN38711.1 hypothetical protein AQJ27_43770 [Streptomyces olivochromogenes]GAX56706.1 hypothetical protein SO3561_08274 [Streptomyces olivochromogenes]